MTPAELRGRRKALGLTQAALAALLWENPKSGRVVLSRTETGDWPLTERTAAWLDRELSKLEHPRRKTRSRPIPRKGTRVGATGPR